MADFGDQVVDALENCGCCQSYEAAAYIKTLQEAATALLLYHDIPDECQDPVVKPLMRSLIDALKGKPTDDD